MKVGWQQTTLGSIAQIGAGNSAPQGDALFADGVHPFFRTSDAGRVRFGDIAESTDYLNDEGIKGLRRFPAGTILFPKSGASTFLNHRVMMGVDGFVSSHLATIVGDEAKVNRRYLLYFLSTVSAQDLVQDHAYPSLNLPLISGIPVALPPLPEQQRIVGILDVAFDGIASAKANAEQNLQNARALFESHLQSVFTQRGEGWVERAIGEACILRSGTTLPPALEKPVGEIPYLKVADMNISANLNGITCSSRYVSKSDVNASNLLPIGTTIFPKRGGAILTNKKRLTTRLICADLNIMGVTPKSGLLPELLFYYFLRLDLREINNGSSIPQINNYSIEPLLISFPESTKEQQTIVAKLDALREETQRLESLYQCKLAALDELKKSLLHQAFSGAL